MKKTHNCPKCSSEFTYSDGDIFFCSECFHEFIPSENDLEIKEKILDANGNELNTGDTVIIIKDLPVKGAPKPIKSGTKIKNIRLNYESDHNIDCKIDTFGSMAIKSEFVRKIYS